MRIAKIALVAVVALAAAVGGGWFWGASGRWACEARLDQAGIRAEWLDARGALLAARVDLFELNFGRAGASAERAGKALDALAGRLDEKGESADAAAAREAAAIAADARHMAGGLDQAANARFGEALAALDRVHSAAGK